jgi:hypothetical protein
MESSALEMGETTLSEQFDTFVETLKKYVGFDEDAYRIYSGIPDPDPEGAPAKSEQAGPASLANWFATDNVMISFFAALSQYATGEQRRRRVGDALDRLATTLAEAPTGSDPLGLGTFNKLRAGFIPRRVNVGVATRRLLTHGFKEYFREAGEVALSECWPLAAE